MRSGTLRKRISIISPVSTARSTDGAPIVTYSTLLSDIWAGVQTFSAREVFKNDYRYTQNDKIFRIRYTTLSIGTDDLIVYESNNYGIQSIIDVEERHREHEIVARRVT
jgi:SPP1 family predicted phage head-tail adaptor